MVNNDGIIGGCYITSHKTEIDKFINFIPELRNKNLVTFEDLIINPNMGGKGLGKEFIKFLKNTYLINFDAIIFSSKILDVQEFYPKNGAKILWRSEVKEFNHKYRKETLKQGAIFIFTK